MLLAWLYIGSGFIVLEHSTHLVWTRRSSHDVIVLWITYSVNIDRQAGPCIQTLLSVYLLDVLVVVVHISHRNCWEYLLLHKD